MLRAPFDEYARPRKLRLADHIDLYVATARQLTLVDRSGFITNHSVHHRPSPRFFAPGARRLLFAECGGNRSSRVAAFQRGTPEIAQLAQTQRRCRDRERIDT